MTYLDVREHIERAHRIETIASLPLLKPHDKREISDYINTSIIQQPPCWTQGCDIYYIFAQKREQLPCKPAPSIRYIYQTDQPHLLWTV